MLSVFAITALVAGALALPTRAKEPIQTQTFQPLVIAESSVDELEFSATEDANAVSEDANAVSEDAKAVSEDALGAETRSEVGSFLDRASPDATIALSIPVTDFTYVDGGIGEPNRSTNKNLFKSFFKSEFGVLGGASDSVLEGPLTATATSTFSPNLTRTQLNNLKSVTVKFEYAFASDPKDTLVLIVRNVTTGKNTFSTTLVSPGKKSVKIAIPKTAFPTTGKYAIIYKLVKPGRTDNDAAGFNNVTVTLVSR